MSQVYRHRSTKPYLIRAIYDWCVEHGMTPYLAIRVDEHTSVPMAYVKDGEIVLNLSTVAARDLQMGNDEISCKARFGGVAHQIIVPIAAVIGIFAKESGEGLSFQGQEPELFPPEDGGGGGTPASSSKLPHLRVVK